MASTALVQAQDATWIGTAGPPNNWNTTTNWAPTPAGPPAYVPTGTAFFNSSLLTATTIDIAGATIGGMNFTNSPGYTFTVSGFLLVNGAGVVVDGGSAAPIFTVDNSLAFISSATAGQSLINVNNTLTFAQTSNAGSALITNDGTIHFQDGGSGGNATIINNASRFIFFNQGGGPAVATAGNATIDNSGNIGFFNSSTAGNSTITTRSGASTGFLNQSTAGSSQQTVQTGGTLTFNDSANAGSSTIDNSGTVNFSNTSSAGTSHITNNTGGFLFFSQSGGSSSAANSTIENSGNLAFFNNSTAANATIITQTSGQTAFLDQSTGGTSSLVINSNGIGNAVVSISSVTDPTFTIGSLAGVGAPPLAQLQIGAKHLIVGGNNQSTSYAGLIFDNSLGGSLTKVGTGTLTLSGAAAYNGATTILGGGLSITGSLQNTSSILVGPNGTLSGNGTISVNGGAGTTTVNGTLAPSSGPGPIPMQLTSNLVLNSGATYLATVGTGATGFAAVLGNVTLGGTLQVQLGGTGFNFGTAYTALASTQPLNQTFDATSGPTALAMHVTYNPTSVQVSFAPDLVTFAAPGNANQIATAQALQTGLAGVTAPGGFSPLFSLDRSAYLTALSQLSGEISTGALTSGLKTMDLFLNLMVNPFLDARGSASGGPSLAFSPESAPSSDADEALGYKQRSKVSGEANRAFAQLGRPPSQFDRRFNLWASGYGGWAQSKGDATVGSTALDSRIGGVAIGADYRPTYDTIFGFAVGAAKTSYGLADNLGGGNADVAQVGAHGALRLNNSYISGAVAYGWHSASTTRTVPMLSTDPINGSFDGHSVNGRVELGSRFGSLPVGVTPFVAAQFQRFFAPSYQEQGTGSSIPFALTYAGTSNSALRSELGVWLDAQPVQDMRFRGRIAWAHQYADAPTAIGAFSSVPSGYFTVTGARPGRDGLLASAAADWKVDRGVALTARFDTEQSGSSSSYSGSGGVHFTW